MTTKQTNNLLSNIHKLVTWELGQNYQLNGCMAYIMECLGEAPTVFDYWFFGGLGGDNMVQIYDTKGRRWLFCLSDVLNGEDYIGSLFEWTGYEYTYVNREMLNKNKSMYIETLNAYIDKGIPVLAKGTTPHVVYCGYEENGETLLYLDGDSPEPRRLTVGDSIEQDWVFVGKKKFTPDMNNLYRESILRLKERLTKFETNHCLFGPAAFRRWADDIEGGIFDGWNSDDFEVWSDFTVYVCNYATNAGGCQSFFDKALELNPDMGFISDIKALYASTKKLWGQAEAIGGGFNVTLEVLQDKQKRKLIADNIHEFAVCMDEVVKLLP